MPPRPTRPSAGPPVSTDESDETTGLTTGNEVTDQRSGVEQATHGAPEGPTGDEAPATAPESPPAPVPPAPGPEGATADDGDLSRRVLRRWKARVPMGTRDGRTTIARGEEFTAYDDDPRVQGNRARLVQEDASPAEVDAALSRVV